MQILLSYLGQQGLAANVNVVSVMLGAIGGLAIFAVYSLVANHLAHYEASNRARGQVNGRNHKPSVDRGGESVEVALGYAGQLNDAASRAADDKSAFANVRNDLIRAGLFGRNAIHLFYAARVGLAIILPALWIGVFYIGQFQLPTLVSIIFVVFFTLIGFIFPGLYLRHAGSVMSKRYRHGFPDFMDLLIVCVEAGISLNAAIERVSRELVGTHPLLAANIQLVSLELRAGKSLSEAMSGVFKRTGLDEVQSLGALLKQSEELGTSLAVALRVYSDEMRDKRMSRAEEKAHALPVKMVLPLGLFIFPVLMIIIMLPLVVRMQAAFV